MLLNPIISASGGLKPQIVVTAPTGSTVTCTTPGGIIIQGIEVSGTWTFADLPGLGTYTINASNGTQSKAKSVAVDRIGVYQVSIGYRLYLYNLGDECTDVTGGFAEYNTKDDWTAGYASELSIDTSGYTKLYATFTPSYGGLQTNYNTAIGFGEVNRIYLENAIDPSGVEVTKSADINQSVSKFLIWVGENLYGVLGLVREKRNNSLYIKKSEYNGQYWCAIEVKRVWLE